MDEVEAAVTFHFGYYSYMSDATPAVATGKENKVARVHFVTVNADAFGVLAARTAVQADIQTFINV